MYKLIPFPNSIQYGNLLLKVPKEIILSIDTDSLDLKAYIESRLIQSFNLDVKFQKENEKAFLILEKDKSLEKNQYSLEILNSRIKISGIDNPSMFYGFQTLQQILYQSYNPESLEYILKEVTILDSPRFLWRGFMLDEARYFLGKSVVKKVLDWMALLKLNKFHWHLTEDQGWRIQIEKYPKLTEIGSKRNGTLVYRNRNKELDGKEHSGYYTKEDIKEIIEYAKARYIDIIPEIEMPGHSVAALAAYPELSCIESPFEVSNFWGVHKDVFCLGNPDTIIFLKDILKEIIDLFPYEYIHTGGDEVPKDRWSQCDKCQAKIKKEKINDEHGLQVKFTNEIVEFLSKKGKKTIVWNELTDERLDQRTVVQFWRGSFDSILGFLENGGSAIVSPSSHYYVDVAYHKTSLSKAYKYEPLPASLVSKIGKRILGIEAELWGEVFNSQEKMEYCAFPRVFAIAESAWTDPKNKNYQRFLASVQYFEELWNKLSINYTPLNNSEPSWFETFKQRFKKGFVHYL